MCSFLCAFLELYSSFYLREGAQLKYFLKSINALCVQTLPVDDVFLLKAFRVEGEFYFQRD